MYKDKDLMSLQFCSDNCGGNDFENSNIKMFRLSK